MIFKTFKPLIVTVIYITLVYVPIRITVEFLYEYKVLKQISKYLKFLTRWYEFSSNTLIPMIAGWIMGVYMGGAFILDFKKDKRINQDDTNKVVSIWMFAHGLIEETLIFTVLGASALWILGIRLFFAIFLVKLLIVLAKRGINVTV